MAVDLAQARQIGRQELERTLAAADEWACEWDYDELDDYWVLVVDRVEYYKVADRFAERTNLVAPIVVSKRDGSVSRTVPGGRAITSVRFPEDFDVELQRLPGEFMFSTSSRSDVQRWSNELRWFRFVRDAPRNNGFDELAACFRCPDRSGADRRLVGIGVESRPMFPAAPGMSERPERTHLLDGRLVFPDFSAGVLRLSFTGDSMVIDDGTVAFAEQVEKRIAEQGWGDDRVETTSPYDQRLVVTPRRYPEMFEA